MKRPLEVFLSVVALMCAVVVTLVLTGVWSPPWVARAVQAANGTVAVEQGRDVNVPSRDGSPEVVIPGSALSGEGKLQIRPVDLPENRSGWAIHLEGAQLTGQATLIFKGVVKEGQPAPLVGFNEHPEDDPQYVLDAEVSGSDLIVQTTHFSNWFTDSWDWLTSWTKNKLDSVYQSSGFGAQPSCEKESEARAGGVNVTSDTGGAVHWCLGMQPDGSTVLKVNNARGYAVSVDRTPGLSIITRDENFARVVHSVSAYMTAPLKKGNTVDVIGPGETIEYKVQGSETVGVRLQPSPPAYLASALWFGIETTATVYTKVLGNISTEAVRTAMDAANCASGFQGMSTSDVTDSSSAGRYFNEALETVMSCSGDVFKKLAAGRMIDVFAVSVAQVLTWAWSGAQTAANGLAAAADTALNFKGYNIVVSYPKIPAPAATTTYSGDHLGTSYTFQHPSDWEIVEEQKYPYMAELGIYDGDGTEMAGLSILTSWDANGTGQLRDVAKSWDTPSVGTMSAASPGNAPDASRFLVRTVIMDLSPYPDEVSMLRWDKPVAVAVSAGVWQASATKLAPFLLTGVGVIDATDTVNGQPYAPVTFSTQRYFNTAKEAEDWTSTEEYRNVVAMIASFNG